MTEEISNDSLTPEELSELLSHLPDILKSLLAEHEAQCNQTE